MILFFFFSPIHSSKEYIIFLKEFYSSGFKRVCDWASYHCIEREILLCQSTYWSENLYEIHMFWLGSKTCQPCPISWEREAIKSVFLFNIFQNGGGLQTQFQKSLGTFFLKFYLQKTLFKRVETYSQTVTIRLIF